MSIPPITPEAVLMFVLFGVPIIALCIYFVYMCDVIKIQDEAKEDRNGKY